MTDISDIYGGGSYLNVAVVKSEKLFGKVLKISDVEIVDFGRGDVSKPKIVLSFEGMKWKLPLNKTNAMTIAETYGPDYREWVGKKIVFHLTKRQFQGQVVDAISVYCPL